MIKRICNTIKNPIIANRPNMSLKNFFIGMHILLANRYHSIDDGHHDLLSLDRRIQTSQSVKQIIFFRRNVFRRFYLHTQAQHFLIGFGNDVRARF